MTTTTNINGTEIFDHEPLERRPLADESRFRDDELQREYDRRYLQAQEERIGRRIAERDRARRRQTARALIAGAAVAAVIAGGAWLIVANANATGTTSSGAPATQPGAPIANIVDHVRPRAGRIAPAPLQPSDPGPSANNSGAMGTGSANAGPSANNTGQMGTGSGNAGPSANNTGQMGTGTGNGGPSANNTGQMGTGIGNGGPSANNTGQMGTGSGPAQ